MLAIDHCNIFSSVYFLAAMSMNRYLVVLATARSRRMRRRPQGEGRQPVRLAGRHSRSAALLTFAGVYSNELQVTSCGLGFPRPERAWFRQAASTRWCWASWCPCAPSACSMQTCCGG